MIGLDKVIAETKKVWPSQLIKDGVINMRLIVMGILGIVLLLAGGIFESSTVKPKIENTPQDIVKNIPAPGRNYEDVLEGKLANLLSQVKGAGSVAVSITLETGSTQEPGKNTIKESKTIQEKDASGGIRTTTEIKESEQILLSRDNGVDRPIMIRELKPVVKGVLVIADGAYDSTVKANLTKAVEAGMGIPSYRITVLPQRK